MKMDEYARILFKNAVLKEQSAHRMYIELAQKAKKKIIKDIDNALDFAISEEQKAYDDYNMITNYIEFGEARETFQEIAMQELRHKTLLQKVKLEFNDNDWNTLKK